MYTPQHYEKLATLQEITDILVAAREAAVRQEQTPKDALDEAARLAEQLVKSGQRHGSRQGSAGSMVPFR